MASAAVVQAKRFVRRNVIIKAPVLAMDRQRHRSGRSYVRRDRKWARFSEHSLESGLRIASNDRAALLMRRPSRFHISRHNGCPLFRAPRTDDGRHVKAGLLAHSSNALHQPSRHDPRERGPASGIRGESLPLTVAGAAAALDRQAICTAFPFSPAAFSRRRQNRHRAIGPEQSPRVKSGICRFDRANAGVAARGRSP